MDEITDVVTSETVVDTSMEHKTTKKELALAYAAGAADKIKALPKIVWIVGGSVILAVIIAVILVSVFSNTYTTPVAQAEKIENAKTFSDLLDTSFDSLDDLLGQDLDAILNIFDASDVYAEMLEEVEDSYEEEVVEYRNDEFGENYKLIFEVEDKERLDKDDLKEFKSELKECAENLLDMVEYAETYGDLDNLADELGISKTKVKKYLSALEGIAKTLKSADITDGYELSVLVTTKGKELDEPEEDSYNMDVYKVNGVWISQDILDYMVQFMCYWTSF